MSDQPKMPFVIDTTEFQDPLQKSMLDNWNKRLHDEVEWRIMVGIEAERAKDRALIRLLVDASARLDFLHECELEAIGSGQPTPDEWRTAFGEMSLVLELAAERGYTPSDE